MNAYWKNYRPPPAQVVMMFPPPPGTDPEARCGRCDHFARQHLSGSCGRCGCTHFTLSSPAASPASPPRSRQNARDLAKPEPRALHDDATDDTEWRDGTDADGFPHSSNCATKTGGGECDCGDM